MKAVNISFEFFPPKTPEGEQKLGETALALEKLSPEFFSVTFGAGGSTREGTLATIKMLQKNTRINAVPHISCIGSTREQITSLLDIYKNLNVKRLVALRGDLPSGMGQSGELAYASELVQLIRDTTGDYFQIEVAAYPEFHPQAKSASDDILNLKRKIDAGANRAITQYFFNPDSYFYFVDECIKLGITAPIIPGIMPITQYSRLLRFSNQCGAEIPMWICKRMESYADDADAIKKFGFEIVQQLCERLLKGGAPGLHFYTLNHAEPTVSLVKGIV